jgi:hypothetical protein
MFVLILQFIQWRETQIQATYHSSFRYDGHKMQQSLFHSGLTFSISETGTTFSASGEAAIRGAPHVVGC